ncbi:hypothetical protein ACH9L7_18505 (plasmid) [Haloferax sp. S1W]|uniref:hypothetical protein n=1 Tax=Haloferax sp. S1W TaxID=3377110 RepID=UPI0037C61818
MDVRKVDGKVTAHQQDGYPDDPSKRSMIDEVEPINQAVRYARYHVNRERGYETIDWRQDPDRTLAVALVIADLDVDEVREYFGTLYDQVRSHVTDTDRPVKLPDGAAPGHIVYQQDVYLGLDDQALVSLVERGSELGPEGLPDNDGPLEDVVAELLETAQSEMDASDLVVEAVSGVHVRWDDASGTYHHERSEQPTIDRSPDARIDVLPFEPESIEDFQFQLVRNLVCQVRDCYVEMGVTPPEPVRIQGLGKHKTATWYEHYNFYQRYHDPRVDIDWGALEPPEHRDD